jgi:predicted nucleic acid-binding protein
VTYLLDVNALIALGFVEHQFHARVADWAMEITVADKNDLATCAITEIGFVRVLTHVQQSGLTFSEAYNSLMLLKFKGPHRFRFLPDNHDISRLPWWVKTGKQLTDGHLCALAESSGSVFATLDARFRTPS